MKKFNSYCQAEKYLIEKVIKKPDFITPSMHEKFSTGFILTDPLYNRNTRSNYEYAEEFFKWLMSGERELSITLERLNPWVKRFVDSAGLPINFSSSYGWKIQEQIQSVFEEIGKNKESRRGYLQILQPADNIIRTTKTTHEYPCTIGLHFFIREKMLHLMVNMRSNNLYSVMPYDVYNFTMLQHHLANMLVIPIGWYYHAINSAHVFKGDIRRWKNPRNIEPVDKNLLK